MKKFSILLTVIVLLSVAAFVGAQDDEMMETTTASAPMVNVEREPVGFVTFEQLNGGVLVTAEISGLTPGWHGFHIHTVGLCEDTEAGPFLQTAGHWDLEGVNHPDHTGDMPMLLVLDDETTYLQFVTDRFEVSDMFDEDGTAVIVHSGPDNYANIPERYGGPDETTLAVGDAGSRVACGEVVEGLEDVEMTLLDTLRGMGE